MRWTPLLIVLCGCGAKVAEVEGDAGTRDPSNAGLALPATPGAGSPCPAEPPRTSEACDRVGLACEYGTREDTSCNVLSTCQRAGSQGGATWQTIEARPQCAAPPLPVEECVAALTAPRSPTDAPCTTQGAHGTCYAHAEGSFARCACVADEDGAPRKTCLLAVSNADCPAARPRLGAACGVDRAICDYGKCFFAKEGVAGHRLRCDGGVWTDLDVACP